VRPFEVDSGGAGGEGEVFEEVLLRGDLEANGTAGECLVWGGC